MSYEFTAALLIFLITYSLIAVRKFRGRRIKTYVAAMVGGALMLLCGVVTPGIEGKEGRGEHLKSLTLFKTAFGGNKCYRMPTVDYYCHSLIAKAYRFFEAIRYHHYR